jgi:hypothetical protein
MYTTTTGTQAANVITMSGSTLSVGAQAVINSTTTTAYSAVSALSATTLIAVYRESSAASCANVLTVSGTSISVGTKATVFGGSSFFCVTGLSATSAIMTHNNGTGILTISGTTVTAGINQLNSALSSVYSPTAAINPTTVVTFGWLNNTNGSSRNFISVGTISGTTFTTNQVSQISMANNVAAYQFGLMQSANRGYLMLPQAGAAVPFTIQNNVVSIGVPQTGINNSNGSSALVTPVVGNAPVKAAKIAVAGVPLGYGSLATGQIFSLGAAN